jgi:hypothetical protein
MHAAHRSVGVSGGASAFRPYSVRRPSDREPAATPIRVLLVPRSGNRQIVAAMRALERILAGNRGLHCKRLSNATADVEGLADADCAVVFGRGLQIVGRWSAVDAEIAAEGRFDEDESFETEVEIAAGARRHPVVDGISTFIARQRSSHSSHLPPDSICLLVRKWAGREFPVAWAHESEGRAFYTTLGHPDDFRSREFARLLLNAIEWTSAGYRLREA